ncbi:MAG TPA: mycothiol system anti-sigma-R factor [Gordonia sp. (in: high G+C Gram-positive bacteria)]|uniref:mycothiol system anti-sigma-R factor n=1 Tax=unclassified Gordonia (in: high G+C Gram-positive bacteria) TaxID=2657482 RepID=UPI000F990EA3|nr:MULTISPECIES: mycothiol system anti-sigma-R factor [unclassified Gordonia (in: high G+C Gram-positive bacteria)]RUP39132.1 MAG: mycothiol system anti-sigma-R factor [Gordonia sp. (in: high G+C Gram-positive bacteria)]HNP56139.1 mycothiol system anti-sigma-R factor [Gordonia sp. (in: high G+C Gram-positive bacteria)]HRC50604.1 mycothiol system anti-sigma-R factor [Gordonia sp. (in: high G+C Gram-positive bacteria)]
MSEHDPEFEALDCTNVLADVWLLLDNECDAGARARLQEHLDRCPSCLAQYGIERQIKELIGRKCGGDRAPQGLADRLRVQFRQSTVITASSDGQSVTHTRVTHTTVETENPGDRR